MSLKIRTIQGLEDSNGAVFNARDVLVLKESCVWKMLNTFLIHLNLLTSCFRTSHKQYTYPGRFIKPKYEEEKTGGGGTPSISATVNEQYLVFVRHQTFDLIAYIYQCSTHSGDFLNS